MILETLPWPQVLLGIAAALAILAVYDVIYVFPLFRRFAALADRCSALEHSAAELAQLRARIAQLDSRGRDDAARLDERLGQLELSTDTRAYEQAIGFASQGEDAERLISCLGLTEGEAKLVRLLHGRPERAASGHDRMNNR